MICCCKKQVLPCFVSFLDVVMDQQQPSSLATLVWHYLGEIKTQEQQTTDWSVNVLTQARTKFAANDVALLCDLFSKHQALVNVTLVDRGPPSSKLVQSDPDNDDGEPMLSVSIVLSNHCIHELNEEASTSRGGQETVSSQTAKRRKLFNEYSSPKPETVASDSILVADTQQSEALNTGRSRLFC